MTYHDTLRRVAEQRLHDYETFTVMSDVHQRLLDGYYASDYVDVLGQLWRVRPDLLDAFFFGKIHALLVSGDALLSRWEIGEAPASDASLVENQQRLVGLAQFTPPLIARYQPSYGATGDDGDGTVRWDASLVFPQYVTTSPTTGTERPVLVEPRQVPLEVGYTRFTTTWKHLVSGGYGVARWPYESRWLSVLVLADHAITQFADVPAVLQSQVL